MLQTYCFSKSQPAPEFIEAFEFSGRVTALTAGDLYFGYKGAQHFQDFVREKKKKTLADHGAEIQTFWSFGP
jgi:hypothetical protein